MCAYTEQLTQNKAETYLRGMLIPSEQSLSRPALNFWKGIEDTC